MGSRYSLHRLVVETSSRHAFRLEGSYPTLIYIAVARLNSPLIPQFSSVPSFSHTIAPLSFLLIYFSLSPLPAVIFIDVATGTVTQFVHYIGMDSIYCCLGYRYLSPPLPAAPASLVHYPEQKSGHHDADLPGCIGVVFSTSVIHLGSGVPCRHDFRDCSVVGFHRVA